MNHCLTELPTPQDQPSEAGPRMPAPAVPETVWLDPVVHAQCVVEIAAMVVTFTPGPIPEPTSGLCGEAWTTDLGPFDLPWVCTKRLDHDGHHVACDTEGVCHAVFADLRLCA